MRNIICIVSFFLLIVSNSAAAQIRFDHVLHKGDSEIVGWEIKSSLNKRFGYRVNGQDRVGLHRREKDLLQQSVRLNNKSVSLLFDIHPLKGSFRTTMGFFVSQNNIDLHTAPVVEHTFDDIVIDIDRASIPSQLQIDGGVLDLSEFGVDEPISIGAQSIDIDKSGIPDQIIIDGPTVSISQEHISLAGRAEFNPIVPYFGIGWGNSPRSSSNIRYSVDIGAMYIGSPQLSFDISGSITEIHPLLTLELDQYVAEQTRELQGRFDDEQILPFVSFGMSIQF